MTKQKNHTPSGASHTPSPGTTLKSKSGATVKTSMTALASAADLSAVASILDTTPDGALPIRPRNDLSFARRITHTQTPAQTARQNKMVSAGPIRPDKAKRPKNATGTPYSAASITPIETWYILRPARILSLSSATSPAKMNPPLRLTNETPS